MAKKRKKDRSIFSLLDNMIEDILVDGNINEKSKIPDILEFIYSDEYLGIKSKNIELYPVQQIMLKVFYKGSVGNRHIELTEEELELCKDLGLNGEENGNVLGKYESEEIFRELVLVWGRRSGKDFIASIIALYEALKLIECPGGDPFAYYGISRANPMTILTIANSSDQAKIAYSEISNKLFNSKYFMNKYIKSGISKEGEIYLLTRKDIKDNIERKGKGLKPTNGSIFIQTGHSDSTSLVGKGCIVLIFDEIGLYRNTSGPSSGEELYSSLTPTINTYVREEILKDEEGNSLLDENGEEIKKTIYDGKIISISSPRGQEGIFWRLYENAGNVKQRLMCRLPTWVIVPKQTEEGLMEGEPDMSPERFLMEYGAEFSGTVGKNFFTKESVDLCFRKKDLKFQEYGLPSISYFAHLDPASTSHNYALCICHKEFFFDQERKERDYCVILDWIKFWTPLPNNPIKLSMVDDYMEKISKRFRFSLVTYDQWNSQRSIQNLRKNAIPAKLLVYSPRNKVKIYDNFEQLVVSGRLLSPYHPRLRKEMFNLQRTYTNTGYKVFPKKSSDIDTDDIVDAVAGAAFDCINQLESGLPQGKVIETGVSASGNSRLWNTMQGTPLGYGTGQQVANSLERRSNAWKYRSGGHPFHNL